MKIINRYISNKCEKILLDIISNLSRKVMFYENIKDSSFGYVDISKNPYEVYLSTDLKDLDFESNLLLEVIFIQLIEQGFPMVYNKYNDFYYKNKKNIEIIGGTLQLNAMLINAIDIVESYGYSTNYYINNLYNQIKQIEDYNISNKYEHALYSCNFITFFLIADTNKKNEVEKLLKSNNIKIYTTTKKLETIYKKCTLTSYEKATLFLCFLFKELNLFDVYHIQSSFIFLYSKRDSDDYIKQIESQDDKTNTTNFLLLRQVKHYNELFNHLKEQIYFLQTSAKGYDKSNEIEAKQMAIHVRILFHQTGNSNALLNQLDGLDNIYPLNSAWKYDSKNLLTSQCLVFIKSINGHALYSPFLNNTPIEQKSTSFKEWWNQIILEDNKHNLFTRKDIVLFLSNKDGGAHIDTVLKDKEKSLKNNKITSGWRTNNDEIFKNNLVYATMRQITYEVLHTLYYYYPNRFNEQYF